MFQGKCFYVATGALIAFLVVECSIASAQYSTETPTFKLFGGLHVAKKVNNSSESFKGLQKKEKQEKQEKPKEASSSDDSDSDGHYDPTRPDMGKSFSQSNKSFDGAVSMQDQEALLKLPVYQGKPFINPSPDSLDVKGADVGKQDASFSKSFPALPVYSTKRAYQTGGKEVDDTKTFNVPDQPLYNSKTFATMSAPGFDKTYTGPLPVLPRKTPKSVLNLSDVSKFPDHPLSVDEVKSLLNHGQPLAPDASPDDDAVSAHPLQNPDPGHNSSESNSQAVDPATRHAERADPLPQ